MAKEESKVQDEQPKKKNTMKIIIVSLLALIVLGGAGVGGLLYMKNQKIAAEKKAEEEEDEHDVAVKKEYYTLEKFVTNLRATSEDGNPIDKFISLEISFELKDDEKKEEKKSFIKTNAPMIKNSLLMTIDKFDDKQLLLAEGKQKLAETLKVDLNAVYKEQQKSLGIKKPGSLAENVLFTSFIIQ